MGVFHVLNSTNDPIGPTVAASHEYLFPCRDTTNLCLILPPQSHELFTRYSEKLLNYRVSIPRCDKDDYPNNLFVRIARL